jgi:tripartite-type tricarboxylate transporter receptor subunit TctC
MVRLADVQQRYAAAGLEPVSSAPAEFGAMIRSEIAKWRKSPKQPGYSIFNKPLRNCA